MLSLKKKILTISPLSQEPSVTVVITHDAVQPVASSFTVTITLSGESSDFVVGDITASGVSLSDFATSDNIVYTVTATPTEESISIQVAEGSLTVDGVENSASNLVSLSAIIFNVWLPFQNDDPAPLTATLTDEYGNVFDVTQPNSNLTIADSLLSKTGTGGADTNLIQSQTSFNRARGKILIARVRVTSSAANAGLFYNGTNRHFIQINSNSINVQDRFSSSSLGITTLINTWYYLILIQRTSGCYYMLSDGTNHYIAYPSSRWNDATAPVKLFLGSSSAGGVQADCDWVREHDLTGSLVTTDWFFDTDSIDDANNGETFTHDAAGWIVFRIQTLPSSGNIEIRFRRQDATNYMSLRVGPSGASNASLVEVVAGSDNSLGTATLVAGEHRLYVNGTAIKLFNDDSSAQKINVTSSNFTSATDGEVVTQETGGNITYVHTMPYNLNVNEEFTNQLLQIVEVSDPPGELNPLTLFVSASAVGGGDGSEVSPYTWSEMKEALGPGDTVYLRGGTFDGVDCVMNIGGNQQFPTTFRPYPGEHVIINVGTTDGLNIMDGDITFNGSGGVIEFTYNDWVGDRFDTAGTDEYNVVIGGTRAKVINCIIHDFGGTGLWVPAVDGVFYGNLVYNIGQSSTGYPMYTQNLHGIKQIKNNIFARTYHSDYNVHQYASGSSFVKNYEYEENIFIGGKNLFGSGGSQAYNVTFQNNVVIDNATQIGQLGESFEPTHENFYFNDNYFWRSSVQVKKGQNYEIKRNEFVRTVQSVIDISFDLPGIDVDENDYQYYGSIPNSKWSFPQGVGITSLAAWQAEGFDLNGSYTGYPSSVPPDGYVVFGNEYDNNRGTIAIKNYSEAATVDVDLSSLPLTVGMAYRLLNAMNAAEKHDFTLASNRIVSIPMTGWTVSQPVGTDPETMPEVSNIFPVLGVFYLIPNYD